MKLIAEINNQSSELEIKREGEKVFARVDDRVYELEVSEVEPNFYLLKYENRIYDIYVSPNGIVNIGNNQFEINLIDPKRLRNADKNKLSADGVSEIKTAMPGKVVRILAAEGSRVSQGEGVMVVEAMKMQNEMKSPKDGVIKEIRFAEGATVNSGDVLVVIE